MSQNPEQDNAKLAAALLYLVPKIVRRIGAGVPLDNDESTRDIPELRQVSELRATPGQLSLLHILVEYKCCTMQELAEHLVVAPSTTTAMVKRLLTQGYVERSRDDLDWRTVRIKPTERGYQVVRFYDHVSCISLQRRLAKLSEEERRTISDALPALQHFTEV